MKRTKTKDGKSKRPKQTSILFGGSPTGIQHKLDTSKCPIERVTVYLDRAEVSRRMNIQFDHTG